MGNRRPVVDRVEMAIIKSRRIALHSHVDPFITHCGRRTTNGMAAADCTGEL